MHLYGGAAAMRSHVMPFKAFDGSFLGALVGAFLGVPFSEPFSEPLGVNFPLPLFLPGMWSGGRSESLPLPLPL